MNVSGLFRTAHAFGASFVFTVDAQYLRQERNKVDTSATTNHGPFYCFPDPQSLVLPNRCKLVGIELLDNAEELPSFHHPYQAAYILGPERGNLSAAMLERFLYTVKIPTKVCVNAGIVGAIAMYDRMLSLGKFPRRPVSSGKPPEKLPEHKFGDPILRKKMPSFQCTTPQSELKEYLKMADYK